MRRLGWIILLAVVVGGGYLLLRNDPGQDQAAETDQQLQTALVEQGLLEVTVRVTGDVAPTRDANLNFDSSGVVEAVLVEAGQTVISGQVLARLDGVAQRIAVDQAQLAVQIAELNLAGLEDGPDDRDLDIARANVNSAFAAFVELRDNSISQEQIRAAELQYEQAQAAYAAAEQASADALRSDLSLAQAGQASFSAEIARLQLEQLREGPPQESLNQAQAQVAQAQAVLRQVEAGPLPTELDRAAVSVRQAQLGLERAQQAYNDTVLEAPFTGIIHRVNIQVGGIATSGGRLPAIQLVDASELTVTVQVDEVDIALIAVGQPVELTFDALGDAVFAGAVKRIADVATQSGGVNSYPVEIALNESDGEILVGMTAAATIIVERLESVLLVPNIFVSLDRNTNRAFVDVQDADGQIAQREIVLGAQNDTYSEVVEGLQSGETVVIDLSGGGFSFFGDN